MAEQQQPNGLPEQEASHEMDPQRGSVDATTTSTTATTTDVPTKVSLTLKGKKRKKRTEKDEDILNAFGGNVAGSGTAVHDENSDFRPSGRFIIPAGENKLRFRTKAAVPKEPTTVVSNQEVSSSSHVSSIKTEENQQNNPIKQELPENERLLVSPVPIKKEEGHVDDADAEALKALQEEASGENEKDEQLSNNLVIDSGRNQLGLMQKKAEDDETAQYKKHLEELPDEIDPTRDVETYQRVPIGDFGAALLRGMGWKDEEKVDSKRSKNDEALPRPHRLGLGATPKFDDTEAVIRNKGRPLRPDQYEKQLALEKQKAEYVKEREAKLAADKQRTLQNGSLVRLRSSGNGKPRRAKIIQLVGVPGLNMVKIQLEGDELVSIIKRGEIEGLLSRDELDDEPFHTQALKEQQSSTERDLVRQQSSNNDRDDLEPLQKGRETNDRDEGSRERRDRRGGHRRDKGESEDERPSASSRDHSRRRKSHNDDSDRSDVSSRDDQKRTRKSHRHEQDKSDDYRHGRKDKRREREKDRDTRHYEKKRSRSDNDCDGDRKSRKRHRRDDHYSSDDSRDHESEKQKRHGRDHSKRDSSRHLQGSKDERHSTTPGSHHLNWITRNIRVRIVTEKLGRKYFKQKGVIVDVTPKGATIQMDETGAIVDHVPERYLETALPKPGGNAIILTSSDHHRFAKGKLLERNSQTSTAVIQVYEDMNVLTLPLDDIAEWCGPLDDDLAE